MVFHRILDFKNGAGFLSGPLFFKAQGTRHKPRLKVQVMKKGSRDQERFKGSGAYTASLVDDV